MVLVDLTRAWFFKTSLLGNKICVNAVDWIGFALMVIIRNYFIFERQIISIQL